MGAVDVDTVVTVASISLMMIGQLVVLVSYLTGMKKDLIHLTDNMSDVRRRLETVEKQQYEHSAIQFQLKNLADRLATLEMSRMN